MKSHELMLISVYPEMLEDIQAVCQTMHIEPTILQWEARCHYQPRGHRRHD